MAQTFKLSTVIDQEPSSVVNLSSYVLDSETIEMLRLGSKFIPKPNKIKRRNIIECFENFSRKIRLMYHWESKVLEPVASGKHEAFDKLKIKSKWEPDDEDIDKKVLELLNECKNNLSHIKLDNKTNSNTSTENLFKKHKSRLKIKDLSKKSKKKEKHTKKSRSFYKLMKKLIRNKNIIIKPADKGSSLIIMNKDNYLEEANRQFNNKLHYRRIQTTVAKESILTLNKILVHLHYGGFMTKKHFEYLKPNAKDHRERRFYLLPKIHKKKQKWPKENMPQGRPVVSDCNSETYRAAELLDNFLNPLSQKHNSYIKDTNDFLQKIRNIKVPEGAHLITLDVCALYTNIPHEKGIEAVKNILKKYPEVGRPDSYILELLKLQLEGNDFEFNGDFYLQTWGTSMGKRFSPSYANIFLAQEEEKALEKCPLKPMSYLRFLDDIFIIWQHPIDKFQDFLTIFNNIHETLKFEATMHPDSIDFLDVTIFKGPCFHTTGYLDTRMFFKKTDTHELLHTNSYHPKHTFKSIVHSQLLRYDRICNNFKDFLEARNTLYSSLKNRGYHPTFLRNCYRNFKKRHILKNRNLYISTKCKEKNCNLPDEYHKNESYVFNQPLQQNLHCNMDNLLYAITFNKCNEIFFTYTKANFHSTWKRDLQNRLNEHLLTSKCTEPHHIQNIHFLEQTNKPCLNKWYNLIAKRLPKLICPLTFSDKSGKIKNILRETLLKLGRLHPHIYSNIKILIAHKRNKNLLDSLTSAKIRN